MRLRAVVATDWSDRIDADARSHPCIFERMDHVAFSQYSGIFRADLSHPVIAEGAVGHFPVGGEKARGRSYSSPSVGRTVRGPSSAPAGDAHCTGRGGSYIFR